MCKGAVADGLKYFHDRCRYRCRACSQAIKPCAECQGCSASYHCSSVGRGILNTQRCPIKQISQSPERLFALDRTCQTPKDDQAGAIVVTGASNCHKKQEQPQVRTIMSLAFCMLSFVYLVPVAFFVSSRLTFLLNLSLLIE